MEIKPDEGLSKSQAISRDLELELGWFSKVLDARMKHFLEQATPVNTTEIPPPHFCQSGSPYANFVQENNLTYSERMALILALVPHLQPQSLDQFFIKNKMLNRNFTEFGGVVNQQNSVFIPTRETLAFMVAQNDLSSRIALHELFSADHVFTRLGVFAEDSANPSQSTTNHLLALTTGYLNFFTTGRHPLPQFSSSFPAHHMQTKLEWDDLIVNSDVRNEIENILHWIKHQQTLVHDWDLGSHFRAGYKCLFHGPPGTGKSLTACIMGNVAGLDVYRLDLSAIVSKYIGETEKNLSTVFDQAKHRNWILFFDEADALFSKRTSVNSANDRYANQEVAYLLQRIELHDGVCILASNSQSNMDGAFMRRFQSSVHFTPPDARMRLMLWKQAIPEQVCVDTGVDLAELASKHNLTGGAIMEIIRYSSLQALAREDNVLRLEDINEGIRKEHAKENRTAVQN